MIGGAPDAHILRSADVNENSRPRWTAQVSAWAAVPVLPPARYGSGSSPGFTTISVMFGAYVSMESGLSSSGFVSAMADWSPDVFDIERLRDARLMIRSVSCAGQDSTFGQRIAFCLPLWRGASSAPQLGQRVGITNRRIWSSRPCVAPAPDRRARESRPAFAHHHGVADEHAFAFHFKGGCAAWYGILWNRPRTRVSTPPPESHVRCAPPAQ